MKIFSGGLKDPNWSSKNTVTYRALLSCDVHDKQITSMNLCHIVAAAAKGTAVTAVYKVSLYVWTLWMVMLINVRYTAEDHTGI